MAVLLLTKFYFYRLNYRKHPNHHWVSVIIIVIIIIIIIIIIIVIVISSF